MFKLDSFFDSRVCAGVSAHEKTDYRRCLNLSSNELHHPLVGEIAAQFYRRISNKSVNQYPYHRETLNHYAGHCGVSPDNVLFTPGSDDAIRLLSYSVFKQSERLILQFPNYENYLVYGKCFNIEINRILFPPDWAEFVSSLKQVVASCENSVVVLTSPHGFNGAQLRLSEIEDIAVLCSKRGSLLVLDDAYGVFGQAYLERLLDKYENVIIIRSFSKALGMAGLRLGAVLAPPKIINYLNRYRGMNGVSSTAMNYLSYSLERWADFSKVWEELRVTRDEFALALDSTGQQLKVYPSRANFLLVQYRNDDLFRDHVARLKYNNIIVRDLSDYESYKKCLRVTVPECSKLDAVLSCFK